MNSLVFIKDDRTIGLYRFKTPQNIGCEVENLDAPGCLRCFEGYLLIGSECQLDSKNSEFERKATTESAYLSIDKWKIWIRNPFS